MDLLVNLIPIAISFFVGMWYKGKKNRDELEYRWKCPDCDFGVRANRHELTLKMADKHRELHH